MAGRLAAPLERRPGPPWQLCPEDGLLHLCLHWGFGHGYAHLLNLTDIDRTVAAYPGLNWDRLLERASAFQVRVPVYFGLSFSRELLGTPIPDRVLADLQPGALRRRWVRRLVAPQWARPVRDAQQYGQVRGSMRALPCPTVRTVPTSSIWRSSTGRPDGCALGALSCCPATSGSATAMPWLPPALSGWRGSGTPSAY